MLACWELMCASLAMALTPDLGLAGVRGNATDHELVRRCVCSHAHPYSDLAQEAGAHPCRAVAPLRSDIQAWVSFQDMKIRSNVLQHTC